MNINGYDVKIIRPEVKEEQIKKRGDGFDKRRLKEIKKALLIFHNLENMATNIYKYQISTRNTDELNVELIGAMLNEMTHIQDFQVKIYEYGFKPSILAHLYSVLGAIFGFTSSLFGENGIRKLGVWVESKAVSHYGELLQDIDWDDETCKVIEKNQADELGHIKRWQGS